MVAGIMPIFFDVVNYQELFKTAMDKYCKAPNSHIHSQAYWLIGFKPARLSFGFVLARLFGISNLHLWSGPLIHPVSFQISSEEATSLSIDSAFCSRLIMAVFARSPVIW